MSAYSFIFAAPQSIQEKRPHVKMRLLALLVAACAWLVAAVPARAQSVEQVAAQAKGGYVSDLAGVLSQSAKDQLTALCTEVDQKTQAQIAVVTVKSLNDQSVTDYSFDLATRMGIGPKSTNRGVLILVAPSEHKYWTQVAYGLEPILSDGKVGGFGREAVPYFRQNDFDGAILLMTRRVADVIAADRGVTLGGTSPPAATEGPRSSPRLPLIVIIVIFAFVFYAVRAARSLGAGSSYRRRGGWWIGPMIGGGWGGGGFGGGGGGGGGFGGFGGGGGGGFGGFGGGSFGGGGAGGSW
ncbi:MAG TPA: TPM domain-containing protein [Verrucomicrobiae bacterium]|nr:TPM domain-containing protein [Verrucomicrobiae bacterium]